LLFICRLGADDLLEAALGELHSVEVAEFCHWQDWAMGWRRTCWKMIRKEELEEEEKTFRWIFLFLPPPPLLSRCLS